MTDESGARGMVGISLTQLLSGLSCSGDAGVLLSDTSMSGLAGVLENEVATGDPLVSGDTVWVSGLTGVSGDVGVSAISRGGGESGVMSNGVHVLLTTRETDLSLDVVADLRSTLLVINRFGENSLPLVSLFSNFDLIFSSLFLRSSSDRLSTSWDF